jgi:UDP-N-acetylmuramate dehydrogenase
MSATFGTEMLAAFGPTRFREHVALAPFTTFKVGGPARWFVETRTSDEIATAVRIASTHGVAVTMLGGGSNVLIADAGIDGVVIRARGGEISRTDEHHVRADAAVTINGLVRWTIMHGCAGLEAWAGTPGTVGGAIFGNAHFGGRNVSELIASVRVLDGGTIVRVPRDDMGFGYDRSRVQRSGEIVLSADFVVSPADPAALRRTARESLAFRKRTQPLESPSAGCIFQNPQKGRDAVPDGIPWSAGALVDRAGLKGAAIGGARVSPSHGNFIVNDGGATARDIRALIDRCRSEVRQRFGVDLREEIVYLGDH